jgi:hypothetical protein
VGGKKFTSRTCFSSDQIHVPPTNKKLSPYLYPNYHPYLSMLRQMREADSCQHVKTDEGRGLLYWHVSQLQVPLPTVFFGTAMVSCSRGQTVPTQRPTLDSTLHATAMGAHALWFGPFFFPRIPTDTCR